MADTVRASHPPVPGLREVLHATFRHHAYPAHTHDSWTLLLMDEGAVRYRLGRTDRIARPRTLSLLPPQIPHDGRSATEGSFFRKRVLYTDADWLPAELAGAAADRPVTTGGAAAAVRRIHAALRAPGDELEAESHLATLRDALSRALLGVDTRRDVRDDPLANRLRVLLDERLTETFTLAEAGRVLGAHPGHLVRAFSRALGITPHRYVIGRRVDVARHLLARGVPISTAAASAGFHDQAHMSRHFRRVLGATPGVFAT